MLPLTAVTSRPVIHLVKTSSTLFYVHCYASAAKQPRYVTTQHKAISLLQPQQPILFFNTYRLVARFLLNRFGIDQTYLHTFY